MLTPIAFPTYILELIVRLLKAKLHPENPVVVVVFPLYGVFVMVKSPLITIGGRMFGIIIVPFELVVLVLLFTYDILLNVFESRAVHGIVLDKYVSL
ncbi:hypothetical protein EBX93_16950 [bacterium]|nr:hypothetical protein [bacterium]